MTTASTPPDIPRRSTRAGGNSEGSDKPMWRAFLTPGWIITALLIIAFSWVTIGTLSPWQLGKDHDIKERNERIEKAFEADPVPLDDVVRPDGSFSPSDEWTRVTMTGRYLPEDELLLRLRPVDGVPAFQSLVPFVLDGESAAGEGTGGPKTVLVNRGWVPANEGGTEVPEMAGAPQQTVTLSAMLRVPDSPHPGEPLGVQGYTMVQSISTSQAAELTGTDLVEPYVQLLSDQPGVLEPIPLPMLERGNHLSYGLQWIAFGIMAPAGLIYFIYSEIRERRRYASEQEELAALAAGDPAYGSGPPLPPETTEAQEEAAETAGTEPQGTPAAASASAAPTRARYGRTQRNPWAAKKRDEERF